MSLMILLNKNNYTFYLLFQFITKKNLNKTSTYLKSPKNKLILNTQQPITDVVEIFKLCQKKINLI